ncbi:50S ribosomal protein L25/general stress protein Ctc [Aeromicrobium ginsengisoli]|uniref:Large ribosomal subunit protein bL25 n=1 Tax=Aeromicrobium ginsengisoli TaxID=363867 RepID=A0A5M4FJM1_9ACTN|nr:50S ribosomal protein L25/general stress protein Ctc [Aeromicrobium ginsengisoli]KAA1400366.1 50S ribosomal protein L25/general stress protein Ctc [Aeromicrobium ginsengisoli]
MAEIKIAAEARTEFGKGAARRIRRADNVPAVLYGHGSDPVHVTLPGHQLMLALKNSNALLTIDLGTEQHLAIPKQVQRDPLKGFIEHADLLIVKKGEKVTVDVRINVVGDAISGNLVILENSTIAVEAEATHIPESFEVSVEGLDAGAQIHASDLELPTGSTLAVDSDILIVNITAAPTEAQLDAELAEAEAEAGIEHDATDAEEAEAAAEAPAEGEAAESSESE